MGREKNIPGVPYRRVFDETATATVEAMHMGTVTLNIPEGERVVVYEFDLDASAGVEPYQIIIDGKGELWSRYSGPIPPDYGERVTADRTVGYSAWNPNGFDVDISVRVKGVAVKV
jgi:hypothetical protein